MSPICKQFSESFKRKSGRLMLKGDVLLLRAIVTALLT